MAIQVVILAAGKGKRMHSNHPKVLHALAGKPLLSHVINTLKLLSTTLSPIIVHGHQGHQLQEALADPSLRWVEQAEQLGTGHALLQALPQISDEDHVLVLCGDVPLISENTLQQLITHTPPDGLGMVTVKHPHPTGYGRVKRDQQKRITGIVEEKDATAEERAIQEINTGIYFIPARYLKKWLPALKTKNAQTEYYLTDIIELAVQDNVPIYTTEPAQLEEISGVNTRMQLAHLERFYQHQQAQKLMQQGVSLYDPARFDIRGEVEVGRDVVIDINVILEGKVIIGDGCSIGPYSILRNVTIAANTEIKSHCVLEDVQIGTHCVIGPFARIRPGTQLADNVHIGNFVEVKNSTIQEGSKVNHLSYIGDSKIGKHVNVGAGTITCNYDGAYKHQTIIGDNVHIGSDTQLVAPVKIGEGATIAAGSTIINDVPPHELTLTQQIEQRVIKGWQRPVKEKKTT